jgi:hypothetical protein
MSELRDQRLDRLEEDVREIKAALGRLEPMIIRIDQQLTSELPHLASKAELTSGLSDVRTDLGAEIGLLRAELAEKPGKMWLTVAIGILIGAYAAGLAGLAALPVLTRLLR